jgi:hypothetical protein
MRASVDQDQADSITRHPYPISKTPAHGLLVASESFITTIDAQARRLAQ